MNSMMTWNPARELFSLHGGLDRFFDDVLAPARAKAVIAPPTDIHETETQYLFSFDLPGLKKDEIRIELNDKTLTVSGSRKDAQALEGAKQGAAYRERRFGAFERAFTLPTEVDADRIEARFEDGVLHVAVPKTLKAKTSQIKIV